MNIHKVGMFVNKVTRRGLDYWHPFPDADFFFPHPVRLVLVLDPVSLRTLSKGMNQFPYETSCLPSYNAKIWNVMCFTSVYLCILSWYASYVKRKLHFTTQIVLKPDINM